MKIKNIPIEELKLDPNNANTHPEINLDSIKRSLTKFGQQKPIVIDKKNIVVAGNGTVLAAKALGWDSIDTVQTDLKAKDKKAYALADNRTAELAEWDVAILESQLKDLDNDGWDLEDIGFGDWEFKEEPAEPSEKDDEVPDTEENEFGVKLGDVWILGNHRLMCGDSTVKENVDKLMNDAKADMVHTDPPYNVNYSNQNRPKTGKKDLGRIKNDCMSDERFLNFLTCAMKCAFDASKEDSSIYIWYALKETINFYSAAAAAGWIINQQIIWKKPMLLSRGRYQWAHEPCVFGLKGSPWFTDDRTKTTVWDFGGYDRSKNVHPTQKPTIIPIEAINNSSKMGSNVLDLFLGSGSTLIACEKTNRTCYGMELDPHYCSVIIKRWQDFTGQTAEKV